MVEENNQTRYIYIDDTIQEISDFSKIHMEKLESLALAIKRNFQRKRRKRKLQEMQCYDLQGF